MAARAVVRCGGEGFRDEAAKYDAERECGFHGVLAFMAGLAAKTV
jgi:hypothetical protein